MTLILCFKGSSGASVLLSFMSAPEPSAPQCSSFTPFPMNRTAKRFGKEDGGVVPAKAGSDSIHGKAIVTPAPTSALRRVMPLTELLVRFAILVAFLFPGIGLLSRDQRERSGAAFVHELRACDNDFHHRSESITIRSQRRSHTLNHGFIREQE